LTQLLMVAQLLALRSQMADTHGGRKPWHQPRSQGRRNPMAPFAITQGNPRHDPLHHLGEIAGSVIGRK
jgi:hypothetical protein